VGGEEGVHAAVDEAGTEGGVDGEVRVVVFGPEAGIFGDVGGVGGVAGFGDAPAVVLQGLRGVSSVEEHVSAGRYLLSELLGCAVINCSADLVPSNVGIYDKALVDGGCGC